MHFFFDFTDAWWLICAVATGAAIGGALGWLVHACGRAWM